MRVAINGTCFNHRPSGARQRFVGLFNELLIQLPEADFTLFEPRDADIGTWFGDHPNLSVKTTPLPSEGRVKRWWQGLHYWPKAFELTGAGVFEALHLPLIRPRQGKTILTIHDVRGLLPEERSFTKALHHRVIGDALSRADEVVTVSAWMRDVLLSLAPNLSVTVIYNGINPRLFATQNEDVVNEFLIRHQLPREYMLAVGHLEPRKNYPRLLKAVAQLKAQGRDFFLVIVGQDSGQGEALRRLIDTLGLQARVRVLSTITDQDLALVYQACRLVVFPSLYEGFGIPILEAMAAHRPIVLSNLPVFNEITQGKALYFLPTDIDAIAHALERGMVDEVGREAMVAHGLLRVGDFRFDRLAQQMASVYRH